MAVSKSRFAALAVAISAGSCGEASAPVVAAGPCATERSFPYPERGSYVGVHANAQNNDLVDCELPGAWAERWHVLQGRAVAQPNTFSLDGRTTYVTASDPDGSGCTVFAIEVLSGASPWCYGVPGAIASSVEVDVEGNLFVTGDEAIVSLDPRGELRWSLDVPQGATGGHLAPSGHLATVTDDGRVLLVDRNEGTVEAELDLPTAYGFVAAGSGAGFDLESNLPDVVVADFAALHGSDGLADGLFKFAGSGDAFSDNTLGIDPAGDLYIVGGGPDPERGSLMKVRVARDNDGPRLEPAWFTIIDRSSASSPSISPDGRWVKVTDGNSATGLLTPETSSASAHVIDIVACDTNTDADSDPDVCVAAFDPALLSGPALGATPVYEGALHYLFDVQLADLFDADTPDLRALEGDTTVWETSLPDGHQWSSVLTVTRSHIVGTMTYMTPSDAQLLSVVLPATASSELVVVERVDGDVVFRAPITDDSTATVSVGPDGSLYVGMLALLHTFATETRPVGGLVRFEPVDP